MSADTPDPYAELLALMHASPDTGPVHEWSMADGSVVMEFDDGSQLTLPADCLPENKQQPPAITEE